MTDVFVDHEASESHGFRSVKILERIQGGYNFLHGE